MTLELIIKQFVVDEFLPDVSLDELDPGHDLLAGGVIDSLATLKVISWLEGEFGVSIFDQDFGLDDLASVAAIESFIRRTTAGPAA
ncbi:MAG: phosphopantetheine-binding protein [Acidimicrobiales bacterium]